MRVYSPVDPSIIGQHFGQNNACIRNGQVASKTGGVCPAGYRNFYQDVLGMDGHNGQDMQTYHRQGIYFPIKAKDKNGNPMEWEVLERDDDEYTGIGLVVKSKKPVKFHIHGLRYYGKQAEDKWADNGGAVYVKATFWHNDENDIDDQKGTPVELGELIGRSDNTGASSGTHLHFSVKLCDKNGKTLDKDNGYRGSVDISKIYEPTFILDVLDEEEVLENSRQQIDRAIIMLRAKGQHVAAFFS